MKTCCTLSTGVLSIIIIITGIGLVLGQVFQNLLYNRIKREVVLENGTEAFAVWQDPPPPVYMQFYFFNLTNPEEVLLGERPAVIELGPYTYREHRTMEEVNFMDNGTKVAAVNPKTYIFMPNMSRGSEDDTIRTVNIPAMTLMETFRYSDYYSRLISDLMKSKGEGLFGIWKVGELLWGYEDPVLKDLHKLNSSVDPNFGLFYKMNGTDDGEYVFYTGKNNSEDFTRIDLWRGQSSLDWWTTDQCNMINGTNGATFHPIINETERLYMFSSDLCRSIYATFESELSVSGVPAYRFVPPSEVFANKTINPDNAGFCSGGNCLSSGLLNVSRCKQGAPIVMSSPHFYQADEKFVDDVLGMQPRKDEHETTIDVNPLTGLLVQAAKRLQVNVFIEKISAFSQTGNVRTLVYPVMYINESILIDEDSAKKLRGVVAQANIVINVPFIIIGLGILLGVVFVVLMCRTERSSPEEQQPLLSS